MKYYVSFVTRCKTKRMGRGVCRNSHTVYSIYSLFF